MTGMTRQLRLELETAFRTQMMQQLRDVWRRLSLLIARKTTITLFCQMYKGFKDSFLSNNLKRVSALEIHSILMKTSWRLSASSLASAMRLILLTRRKSRLVRENLLLSLLIGVKRLEKEIPAMASFGLKVFIGCKRSDAMERTTQLVITSNMAGQAMLGLPNLGSSIMVGVLYSSHGTTTTEDSPLSSLLAATIVKCTCLKIQR